MEAVSTLIFAAARFSDLPELCELRRAFLERFGSYIESFVNSEVLNLALWFNFILLSLPAKLMIFSVSLSFLSFNLQFMENMQRKSFSVDKKLQLMQEIAQEFSVSWDYKTFRQKLSNHAPASVSVWNLSSFELMWLQNCNSQLCLLLDLYSLIVISSVLVTLCCFNGSRILKGPC